MSATRSIKTHLIPGTIGLVVCGGQSSRMGTDKSLLLYHDKPQRYHLYDMLQPFCENVYISCNKEQAMNMEPGYDLLPDHPSYSNIGPMAALLSAFKEFPQKNILFIGCDYPFLNVVDLRLFAGYCHTDTAISFYNEKENIYEPLLAWYPCSSAGVLKNMEKAGGQFFIISRRSHRNGHIFQHAATARTVFQLNFQRFFYGNPVFCFIDPAAADLMYIDMFNLLRHN